MKSKHTNKITPGEKIQFRTILPTDYHCKCIFCQGKFFGEMFHIDKNKYYSNLIRKNYYGEKRGVHLDVGQAIGYRWAIQNLCPEEGKVFDPTVGSGTAIVESINNNRDAYGIELEYPHLAKQSAEFQESNRIFKIFEGDARNLSDILERNKIGINFFDLIINGTPYPKIGSTSSDCPQRTPIKGKETENSQKSFDYEHEKNMGLLPLGDWEDTIFNMYKDSLDFLKIGGKLVIIVKDMTQNKKPYLLHKIIGDLIMKNSSVEYEGFFIHKHTPTTMFMNTYPKRFPGVVIPLYQTGLIFKKISE